uniref:Major facilitator superfamily (MFS) profile domain-containing protein n=1 Tax=Timema douglasi TaxID=61478 RepID=A0A7R8VP68_TIMDO|nr:unnamed protein product [Timema douglasi]
MVHRNSYSLPRINTLGEVKLSPIYLTDDVFKKIDPSTKVCESTDEQVNDTTDFVKVRFVFLILGMLGIAILFIVRVNLSVAIVAMVNNTALNELEILTMETDAGTDYVDLDVCQRVENISGLAVEDGEFTWSEETQGFILSGYFYGYAVGQLPGGILAERYGGKLMFGLGTFISALLTVVSPFAIWVSEELFFALRLLEGLAGSVTFPAIQYMISNWAPPDERSKFSMIFSGGYLGIVTCMPLSGLLCSWEVAGGWPMVFYVFGAVGCAWYLPWLYFVHETPADHPRISREERRYIEHCIGPGNSDSNAALSTLPYVAAGIFGLICSPALDFFTTRGYVSRMNGFRILLAIASFGPAITLIIIPLVGCRNTLIIFLLTLNGPCLGAQYTGIFTNLLDLAPNFSGTMLGISNTFCNGAGILAPVAVGFLTNNNQTRSQWNIVFYISATISMLSYLVYLILCQSTEQSWNSPCAQNELVTVSSASTLARTEEEVDGYRNQGFEKEECK